VNGRWIIAVYCAALAAVHAAPLNDLFARRAPLSGATNYISASNADASAEPNEPVIEGIPASTSVWWTWTAPNSGTWTISTEGSDFDTLLGVYTGSALTNLSFVASDDDSGTYSTSVVIFRAIAGETYQIVVEGFAGDSGQILLRLGPSGYTAPAWSLATVTGSIVSSSAFRSKVLIVDFFETVCTACRDEAPVLSYTETLHTNDGFEIVGISTDLSLANVVYNIRALGINYTVVMDRPEVEAAFGGPMVVPTKFVIDREGKIQRKIVGGTTLSELSRIISPLIRGATALPMKIQQQQQNIVLSWPVTEFGWNVESAPAPGALWSRWAGPIFDGVTDKYVIIPIAGPSMLFRLHKP